MCLSFLPGEFFRRNHPYRLAQLSTLVLRIVSGDQVLCHSPSSASVPLLAVSLHAHCAQPFSKLQPTPMMAPCSQWSHVSECPSVYLVLNSHITCVVFLFFSFKKSLYPFITIVAKCVMNHPVSTLFGCDLAWGHNQRLQSHFYGK